MAARGRIPAGYGERSNQVPEMMRHGQFPAATRTSETLPPELLENRLAVQQAEIERLAGDNHRLASTHVVLRHDLVASQQDIQRLRAHISSTRTETDIQIRVLLEKIAKWEAERSASESIKNDLQQAHIEARGLLAANQDLNSQIQRASLELEKARADLKKLPDMHSEHENLRKEHQLLRTTFEHEKGWNVEKVEKMKLLENDLVDMSRQLEDLHAQVENAQMRARVPTPYAGPYMNQNPIYPPPPHMHNAAGYIDGYGRTMQISVGASGEHMMPYGVGNAPVPGSSGGASFPGSSGGAVFPGSAGGAAFPGSAGGASFPGSAGGAAFPGSSGGAAFPGSSGGAAFPGSAGGAAFPGSAGGAAFPGSAGGSGAAFPGSAGGAAFPGSSGGAAFPGSAGGAAFPGSSGGVAFPGSAGGALDYSHAHR